MYVSADGGKGRPRIAGTNRGLVRAAPVKGAPLQMEM